MAEVRWPEPRSKITLLEAQTAFESYFKTTVRDIGSKMTDADGLEYRRYYFGLPNENKDELAYHWLVQMFRLLPKDRSRLGELRWKQRPQYVESGNNYMGVMAQFAWTELPPEPEEDPDEEVMMIW